LDITKMKKKEIFIDPGHGGNDNGATWGEEYDYVEEDDLNLIISFLLRYELLLAQSEAKLSRERDIYVSLADRAKIANEWNADVFVSIHADAWHNETAKGFSVHVYPYCKRETLDLADRVLKELVRQFPQHTNRGIKRSNFHVLRKTNMPAILIEAEFLSNKDTRRFLKEPENQLAIGQAIARGIQSYLGKQESILP